jgi:hypothetical protein
LPFLSHHCHHYGASSLRRSFIETHEGKEEMRALQLQANEISEVFFSIFLFFLCCSLMFFLFSPLSLYLFFYTIDTSYDLFFIYV